jgi:hypothetical protein
MPSPYSWMGSIMLDDGLGINYKRTLSRLPHNFSQSRP